MNGCERCSDLPALTADQLRGVKILVREMEKAYNPARHYAREQLRAILDAYPVTEDPE